MNKLHLERAIELSYQSLQRGGGPFGAVVVLDGRVLGEGMNSVVPSGDPTAHAEIVAIRNACQARGSHSLRGAIIYTSCEPCPMCLGAIWWARISRIVFANNRNDAAQIGFDDAEVYKEICTPIESRTIPAEVHTDRKAKEIFEMWMRKADKTPY